MSAAPHDGSDCITERETPHGYWWRYTHSRNEPRDTLTAAIIVAGEIAAEEARKRGKTYLLASTPLPTAAVYVFACDHPDAKDASIEVMFEFTRRRAHPPRRPQRDPALTLGQPLQLSLPQMRESRRNRNLRVRLGPAHRKRSAKSACR